MLKYHGHPISRISKFWTAGSGTIRDTR